MGVVQPWHLILIVIIALVIMGPGKLGDVGGQLGRAIRDFRSTMDSETEGKSSNETVEKSAK
jgi:sec-independent protein translocase protein TatA